MLSFSLLYLTYVPRRERLHCLPWCAAYSRVSAVALKRLGSVENVLRNRFGINSVALIAYLQSLFAERRTAINLARHAAALNEAVLIQDPLQSDTAGDAHRQID